MKNFSLRDCVVKSHKGTLKKGLQNLFDKHNGHMLLSEVANKFMDDTAALIIPSKGDRLGFTLRNQGYKLLDLSYLNGDRLVIQDGRVFEVFPYILKELLLSEGSE